MTIAVDFDGVLSIGDYEFPDTGEPNDLLFNFLKEFKSDGHKLILWSCRENTGIAPGSLDVAVEFCAKYGLTFDAVNDNLEEIKKKYGVNSRKISADKYIDDKAWNPNVIKDEDIVRATTWAKLVSQSRGDDHYYEEIFSCMEKDRDTYDGWTERMLRQETW